MTTFEQLQSNKGGLLHLRTELFWYDGRGHDNDPGRFCLLLDVLTGDDARNIHVEPIARTTAAGFVRRGLGPGRVGVELHRPGADDVAALLLIDGHPQWIWVAENDIEVLNEAR